MGEAGLLTPIPYWNSRLPPMAQGTSKRCIIASKRWKLLSVRPHSPYGGSVTPHVLIPLICLIEAEFHR